MTRIAPLPRVIGVRPDAGQRRGPHAGDAFWQSARADDARKHAARADDARKHAARERLIVLTRLLDSAVEIPVLRTRVGLDALLGLVPGIGDLVGGVLGLYLVLEARQLGASRWLQARMIGNLLVDAALGTVPLAGDLFDVFFKAHQRNLRLLQKELGEPYIDAVTEPTPRR